MLPLADLSLLQGLDGVGQAALHVNYVFADGVHLKLEPGQLGFEILQVWLQHTATHIRDFLSVSDSHQFRLDSKRVHFSISKARLCVNLGSVSGQRRCWRTRSLSFSFMPPKRTSTIGRLGFRVCSCSGCVYELMLRFSTENKKVPQHKLGFFCINPNVTYGSKAIIMKHGTKECAAVC